MVPRHGCGALLQTRSFGKILAGACIPFTTVAAAVGALVDNNDNNGVANSVGLLGSHAMQRER